MTTNLWSPPGYRELSYIDKAEICSGCGTKGFGAWIVPNTLWGLNIEEACNIHDYMYKFGETIEDKNEADRTFLNNMIRTIEGTNKWLKPLRLRRAWKYYEAVAHFGGPAFWSGKN